MAPDRDDPSLRPLTKVLAGPDGLSDVIARAQTLARLDARVKAALPPLVAPQCTVANVRDNTLVVATTSSAFAARLRLMTRELLQIAHACGVEVDQVKIRIGFVPAPPPLPAPRPPISATARQHLRDAAQKTDDPELRAMLEAFAALSPPSEPPPNEGESV